MMKKLNKFLWLLAILCAGLKTQAQKPEAARINEYINKYGKEYNQAIYNNSEHMVLDIDKKGAITAANKVVNERLMLTSNTSDYNESDIYYNSFMEVNNVKAYSYEQAEGSYKKVEAKNFATGSATSRGIFYDDQKKTTVTFAAPTKGTITHLEYEEVYKEPRFITAFHFGYYVPVINQEYSVTFNKKIKLKYLLKGENTDIINFTKTETKSTITYTWKAATVRFLSRESRAVNFRYYSPHVIIFIEEAELNGKQEPILKDVSSLYNWYYSMAEKAESDTSNTLMLKQLTDSLTQGVSDELEKAKRIYYWVQANLKYVAFEDGLGGFVPRMASDIYEKRYGDCKDMSCLLHRLLTIAGIDARMCWIGTRDIPYSYSEVPTPAADNHMITTCFINNRRYFIDGTCAYCPFDMPSSFTQGKEALISLGKGKFIVEKVPEINKRRTQIDDSTYLTIEGTELVGEGRITYRGYVKIDMMYAFHNGMSNKYTFEEKLKEFIKQRGNNKISVDYARANQFDNSDSVLTIWYKFRVPDYVTFVGNDLYLSMNMEKIFDQYRTDFTKVDVDLDNEFAYTIKNTLVLQVPANAEVGYLPANTSFNSDFFRFNIDYNNSGKQVRLDRRYELENLFLRKENIGVWIQCNNKVKQAYKDQVMLKVTSKK